MHAGQIVAKLIGWGEENGVKYWILANTYNENWGENGFIRMATSSVSFDDAYGYDIDFSK